MPVQRENVSGIGTSDALGWTDIMEASEKKKRTGRGSLEGDDGKWTRGEAGSFLLDVTKLNAARPREPPWNDARRAVVRSFEPITR